MIITLISTYFWLQNNLCEFTKYAHFLIIMLYCKNYFVTSKSKKEKDLAQQIEYIRNVSCFSDRNTSAILIRRRPRITTQRPSLTTTRRSFAARGSHLNRFYSCFCFWKKKLEHLLLLEIYFAKITYL